MVTVSDAVKKLVQSLEAEFKGFEELPIRSEEYEEKVVELDSLVMALAQLHPRWSEKEDRILPIPPEDDRWGAEQEGGELSVVFELLEGLLWTWRAMDASNPTAASLIAVPRFANALYSLVGKTERL